MLRTEIFRLFSAAAAALAQELGFTGALPATEILEPRDPSHGDFACNFAMAASKTFGIPPREIAERLVALLPENNLVLATEVAGPGFINIRLNPASAAEFLKIVLSEGTDFVRNHAQPENPQTINVEFVSVNPNGPITVGSGRGAAFGSTLCNVLEAAGHSVHREYYINDGVNSEQMRLFAESVRAICLGNPVPENGYKGDYVHEVAAELGPMGSSSVAEIQLASQKQMIQRQESDLSSFGVEFDTWFSEQSLHDSGVVESCVNDLIAKGAADEQPIRRTLKLAKGGVIEEVLVEVQGDKDLSEEEQAELANDSTPNPLLASKEQDISSENSTPNPLLASKEGATLWLRSTKFGDDMDRVLRRRDGRLTYISSDVAYHKDKFNRGSKPSASGEVKPADKLITVLGPDHHGYIARLHAVVGALLESETDSTKENKDGGVNPLSEIESKIFENVAERDACAAALAESRERLEVVIFQIVRFVKEGKPAPMRKRDGNIYSLRDLISEIGKTAAPAEPEAEQIRIGRDVSRFFYLMRSHDTHMDFDIDLATKQSDENPVFYCQYAHARICSILEKATEAGLSMGEFDPSLLVHERELALAKKALDLTHEIARCADDYGVHRLTTYATELARTFHHFYDACRVIQTDQPELSAARLALTKATQIALRAVFGVLGISSPERMERAEPTPA